MCPSHSPSGCHLVNWLLGQAGGASLLSEVAALDRLHGRLFHPRQEAGRGVGVPLTAQRKTRSDAEVFKSEAHGLFKQPDTAAKSDDIRDGRIHMV
jgi:hypothetical protein